jgi:cbb3-type cytochrome oxidase maturation protein
MSVIIVLIGFSLLVAVVFLFAFLWAVKNGQYEDRYTPSVRILFDNNDNKTVPGKINAEKKSQAENKKSFKTKNLQ